MGRFDRDCGSRYRIKGDISSTDLRTIEDWTVARQLKQCPASRMCRDGWFIKRYRVRPDRKDESVRHHASTLSGLDRGSANAGGSCIEKANNGISFRHRLAEVR